MKLVSVIIPAYNSETFITKAIDSVLSQSYPHIETIVVDDGSTDHTARVVRSYGDRIKYVYQDNQGHAKARNRGLQESRGEYCAFLDADDCWLPQKVELQVDILERNPDTGITHCNHTKIDEQGRIIPSFPREKKYISGWIFKNLLLRKGHIGTSTAMFRRE